jgi:hypothetical protein
MKAAPLGDAFAEADIGSPTRHIGGDGDHAGLARLGDDRRLLRMRKRIQHPGPHASRGEGLGQRLTGAHAAHADQHGPPASHLGQRTRRPRPATGRRRP